MKVITFYKYISIEDPESFAKEHLSFCKNFGLKGKILVSKEGINGGITGSDSIIDSYKKRLTSYINFKDIQFKETFVEDEAYRKMFVRVRKEIVTFDVDVDYNKAAKKIEPEQLKKILDKKEEVILLDVRNNYETKIGRFKGAVDLDIKKFTEFKNKIDSLKSLKNKTIVTYCTGGVRCEKASALLVESGFNDVFQLDGGILNYADKCSDAHWEGKCFVFDTRGAIDIDPNSQSEPITQCVLCHLPNSDIHNCALTTCDRFFTACRDCFNVLEGCCSKRCRGELLKKPVEVLN